MLRAAAWFFLALCQGPLATAAPAGPEREPLRSVREIRLLSVEDASRRDPVSVEATVTYNDPDWRVLFVQDETAGIFVNTGAERLDLDVGQRVRIKGRAGPGEFAPVIESPVFLILSTNALPAPIKAESTAFHQGGYDCQRVWVEGALRSARTEGVHSVLVLADGVGSVEVRVAEKGSPDALGRLIDARVRVEGVAGTMFDDQRRVTGVRLFVTALDSIQVVEAAATDTFNSSAVSIGDIRKNPLEEASARRQVVQGVVTWIGTDGSFFIQDATRGIQVFLAAPEAVALNSELLVAGFPDYGGLAISLRDSRIRTLGPAKPVAPRPVDPAEALQDRACHGALVRIDGRLLHSVARSGERLLVVQSGETVLSSIVDDGDGGESLSGIRRGSRVTIDGICAVTFGPDGAPQAMQIRMRGVDDLRVVAGPPFWTSRRATLALIALALAVAASFGWGWSLRRQVKERTVRIRSRLEREETFSEFGMELSAASSREEVGQVIVDAAQRLVGWDSCYLDLYDKEHGELEVIIVYDTEAGKIKKLDVSDVDHLMNNLTQTVVADKGQLILREGGEVKSSHGLLPFGDEKRLSASLMFVPCRSHGKPAGILSIQSYSPNAYTEEDLKLLQSLADHCAGALTRVRALEALRASEIRFRTVADGLGEGIMITDLDDVVLYVNARMTEMTGYRAEEMVGQLEYELIQSEDDWGNALRRNRDREKGKSERYELLLRRKDGARFWADVCAAPFVDAEGEIVGTLGCVADIDARKRAEMELQESETRFRSVAENLGEGIVITDLDDRALYANSRMTELTGFEVDDLIGRPAYELLQPKENWAEAQDRNRDRIAGVSSRYETRLRRRDGSLFWAEVFGAPFRNPDGQIVGTLGCLVDIDERKRTMEELRQSERRFSRTFHASPIPLCLITMDDGSFVDANRAFFRVSEYRREEVIGRSAQDLGLWDNSHEHARFIALVKRHGVVRDLECGLLTKHGERREYLLSAETIELSSSSGLLVSCFDITERLNLEEQLRHSQKMEAVGQLAAGVAHDFNNILTIVKGHASLLAQAEGLNPEERESLGHISRASERAADLTRQLLAFSRKQVMKLARIDLNKELEAIARMLQSLLGEPIALRRDFCQEPASIFADIGMIGQIVTNLAMNARDAMPRGGELTFSTSLQFADHASQTQGRGGFVRLRISDTGEGIAPEALPRVFEPFFSTKDIGKGTGLGLSTVYGLVDQHKGRISVESKVGEGTTFTICFPLEPGPIGIGEPIGEAPFLEAEEEGGEIVLAVEDEPALRNLMRVVLQRYGYRVLTAADGNEALDLWRRESGAVGLLLTDVVMPGGLSGFELAEELLRTAPDLPVIYTSGYSVEINSNGVRLTEGYDFLPKPYRPDALAGIVRRRLRPESASLEA